MKILEWKPNLSGGERGERGKEGRGGGSPTQNEKEGLERGGEESNEVGHVGTGWRLQQDVLTRQEEKK